MVKLDKQALFSLVRTPFTGDAMHCSQKYQAINKTQEELSDLGSVKASQVCVFAGHRTETLGQCTLQNLHSAGGSSDFQSIFRHF